MSASKLLAIFLPPEIIEAILRLLPAKSLGRFKSVSKTWNSLISDPQFIKKHIHHHLQTPTKLILVSNTKSVYSMDTNQLLPYLNINNNNDNDDEIPTTVKKLSFRLKEVLGSCNGLVLAKDENETIFLINPTTHERWEVPPTPFVLRDDVVVFVLYGFGYDASTDDYKVVSISLCYLKMDFGREPVDTYVSVYSVRNNSWKKMPDSSRFVGLCVDSPLVINQSFHWLHYLSDIVSFSFTTEEFNKFRLQFLGLFEGQLVRFYGLVDIGGKLGVFVDIGDCFELWVMEDYGVSSSWTKVCCLEFKDRVKPLCLVEGSDRDIILDVEGDVVIFNIDGKRCRNVRIEGGSGGFTALGTYAESLESPKRILTTP